MKHIRLILAIAISALLAQNTHAVVYRISQMVNYNTGVLGADAGTGSLDGWGNTTTQVTVTNGSGSLTGTNLGLVASAGDRVFLSATSAFNTRNQFVPSGTFPTASTDTNIYYSFLYRFVEADDVSADGEVLIRLNTGNSGTGSNQHWDLIAKNIAGQIQIGICRALSGITNFATTNINEGETFFVVVRQQMVSGTANDSYDLWINPPTNSFGVDESSVPPVSATTGITGAETAGSGPGRFVIVAGANSEFDELRIASLWSEVTPQFGQCDPAGFSSGPTNLTVVAGINAVLRATASGTSPSLQWQVSTNGGVNWSSINGAFSTLFITRNFSLADNGIQYRALATIPCDGSIATSSVATVTVTAPVTTPVGLIVDDPFVDPSEAFNLRDNIPVTISNSVWRTAPPAANLDALSGDMIGSTLPSSASLWLGYFVEDSNQPVDLAVWSTIKVTLPFSPGGNVVSTNAGSPLRFGIFDYADGSVRLATDSVLAGGSQGSGLGVRGYMSTVAFGTTLFDATPIEIFARTFLDDINLMGTTGDYTTLGSGPTGLTTNTATFASGSPYTLQFTVTRTAFNTVIVSNAITGLPTSWAFSVIDTNYAYHRFDAFGIRPNSQETTADTFTFPDFKVEVLPFSVPAFNITDIQRLTTNSVRLAWNSSYGVWYQVQSRDSLSSGNWTTNATLLSTIGGSLAYTNTGIAAGVNQRYYRVVATP